MEQYWLKLRVIGFLLLVTGDQEATINWQPATSNKQPVTGNQHSDYLESF
jgi:hypothetical protein